jgi:hypothetical protein
MKETTKKQHLNSHISRAKIQQSLESCKKLEDAVVNNEMGICKP